MNISCVIPTHNRNAFLLEAIRSAMAQTFPAFEIIVVNNGEQTIDAADKTLSNVKIVETVRDAGVSQARNIGATVAKGQYIAFLDDDDLWHSEYLEKAVIELKNGAECIISRVDKLLEGNVIPYKNPDGNLTIEYLLTRNPGITGSNIVIDKRTFLSIGGFDTDLPPSEDKAFMLEILTSNIKTVILPENQVLHRIHKTDRLTDNPDKRYRGTSLFVKKYRSLMNRQMLRYNMMKAYKYKSLAGCRFALIQFMILKTIYRLSILLGKEKYGNVYVFKNKKSKLRELH